MSKNSVFATLLTCLLLAAGWLLLREIGNGPGQGARSLENVRFDTVNFIGEAPFIVANALGLFEQHGLNVQLNHNSSGADSIERLYAGQTDFATAADTAVVYAALRDPYLVILSGTTRSENMHGLVARRDHGIETPQDLRGKRLGLYRGTASDYVLDRFAKINDLAISDLDIVDLPAEMLVEELLHGQLDAIVSWHPNLTLAAQALGEDGIELTTRGMKTMDWILLSRRGYLDQNMDVAERVLRALQGAIDYINEEPIKSRQILSREVGLDEALLERIWSAYAYQLNLSESLLANLEEQARWMRQSGRIKDEELPDFPGFIDQRPLQSLRSGQAGLAE